MPTAPVDGGNRQMSDGRCYDWSIGKCDRANCRFMHD